MRRTSPLWTMRPTSTTSRKKTKSRLMRRKLPKRVSSSTIPKLFRTKTSSSSMDQPTATEALRKLDPLVGAWTLEARPPDGEPLPGGGRSTFEWHPSGAYLVQHTIVELPEAP